MAELKKYLWIFLPWVLLCVVLMVTLMTGSSTSQPPHIVFIVADDLGWNDVGFHGSPDIPTPNIDALARSGISLHSHYTEWACSPSRGALMTGRYSMRLGLQHLVIMAGERTALPLSHIILPEHLRKRGYSTHLVGKWHLGYHKRAHMPTSRGFDSFFGYLNGVLDYYDYTNLNDGLLDPMDQIFFGVDLYNDTTPVTDFRGRYLTHLITEKATDNILQHDVSKPLFLMVSHAAPHTGGNVQRLQAPPQTVLRFKHIEDKKRRVYAGMVSALDDSIGAVFEAMHQKGMLENAVVVFLSDNGGVTQPEWDGCASNAPLRGYKLSLWEGGVRVPALVWSPLLPTNQIWNGLMHISDWLPTLYRAAGGDPQTLGTIDGHDVWGALSSGGPSPRSDLLLNVDPVLGQAAYRKGALKVIRGGSSPPILPLPPSEGLPSPVVKGVVRDIVGRMGLWPEEGDLEEWYDRSRVRCADAPGIECDPSVKPCLFNVTADPCERRDLADQYPEELSRMLGTIDEYASQGVEPQSKRRDPLADPACHRFTYVPWMEPEHLSTDCTYLS